MGIVSINRHINMYVNVANHNNVAGPKTKVKMKTYSTRVVYMFHSTFFSTKVDLPPPVHFWKYADVCRTKHMVENRP